MRKLKKAGILLSLLSILSGCSDPKTPSVPIGGDVVEGKELFCLCESEEKAKEIADSYEIELVSWGNGVAVFHTEKDLETVIQYGIKNDLPLLEPNRKKKLN